MEVAVLWATAFSTEHDVALGGPVRQRYGGSGYEGGRTQPPSERGRQGAGDAFDVCGVRTAKTAPRGRNREDGAVLPS